MHQYINLAIISYHSTVRDRDMHYYNAGFSVLFAVNYSFVHSLVKSKGCIAALRFVLHAKEELYNDIRCTRYVLSSFLFLIFSFRFAHRIFDFRSRKYSFSE